MRKIVALLAFVLVSECSASAIVKDNPTYSPPAGAIILRVEVTDVEFTDWSPDCVGEDTNCVPFDFWYKYRARVRDVVRGSWTESEIEFTHLQHAEYIPEITRDCYVVLAPSGPELGSKIGVSFVADRILSRRWKSDKTIIQALRDGA